jgi:AcrR family transcriptional regulator
VTQASATPPARRDRLRTATMEEITATARRLLVEQGPEAASLRAIAREMGMTAPGLYRYYSSREELLRHVVADIFRELSSDIQQAIAAAVPSSGPAADAGIGNPHSADADSAAPAERRAHGALKMIAACREFRHWALGHPDEYALLFGVPLPGLDDGRFDIAEQCALEFAGTFYTLFLDLWNRVGFPVSSDEEIDPEMRAQLARFRDKLGLSPDVPVGVHVIFLRCWMLLYGAVSMEVFGHLGFALTDPAPMFELTLRDLARLVGLEYPVPNA